ncbi:hypothetical protein [Oceanicaulis sp. MMSF_3324]|uniref:hypothetical protein n=1 Tax=Oceanicaulis sp. MMSF_3324 TaxID=3046702 RepID=UPI00273EA5E8|nr:hypothetical protein [Oceanicaulis sp. MMSF_3324]
MSSAALSKLRAELKSQATPRAMVGLAALILIVSIWALGELSASVSNLHQNVEELERARRLEQSLVNDQGWLDQAGDIQARLSQTQDSFWSGSTNGIVAAQLQGAVERAARNAGLSRVRVNVTGTPDALGEQASLFEISLTARDSDGQFLAFFQELGRAEHQIMISRFNWRRPNGALDVRLVAPARIAEAGPAS